jgi:hypothetical protein
MAEGDRRDSMASKPQGLVISFQGIRIVFLEAWMLKLGE